MTTTLQLADHASKRELYADLVAQLGGLLQGERDPWANAANAAALPTPASTRRRTPRATTNQPRPTMP